MNYSESQKILEEIKNAKRIVICCHIEPDPDSVGSTLSLYRFCRDMDKEIVVISKDDIGNLGFLADSNVIKFVNYQDFDFCNFDLFIIPDSESWFMVFGDDLSSPPNIKTIIIDHHITNKRFGKINLIDSEASSTSEVLFNIYRDWGVKIDENVATDLMTGIIGDTGSFRYRGTSSETFQIASELLKIGADRGKINFHMFQEIEFELERFWGEVLMRLEIDKDIGIVWSAIPYEVFEKYNKPKQMNTAGMFFQTVRDTKIGVFMLEKEPGYLNASFRARENIDVSEIASSLGGGGHKVAAGAAIKDTPFEKAVEKVLQTCREYVKKNSS